MQRLTDFWDCFVYEKLLMGVFQSLVSQFKICLIPEEDLWENGQIPEDDLPRMALSPDWPTSRNLKREFDETSSLYSHLSGTSEPALS